MKKLVVLAFIALSMLAAKSNKAVDNPFPQCDPCPWVR